MMPATKWEAADKAFNKGVEAYIEFGQECARLNTEGTTQQEIGNRYGMTQGQVAKALTVGGDKRIIHNMNTLPRSQESLYLLTTLDDKGFELLAKPDTTQADIKAYKEAQQPPKPKAIPAPAPSPTPEPEQPEEQEMKKFDTGTILIQEGACSSSGSQMNKCRSEIREMFGDNVFDNATSFREAVKRYVLLKNPAAAEEARRKAEEARRQLPDSWQKKFDKALAARIEIEIADMQKQFEEQLREAREQLELKLQEAEAERQAAFQYRLGIDSHMTMDEFKLVRSCLHPDRAPEDQRDKFNKAFSIFNRLEKTVNTKAPISILRRHGWEKASPFYKAA